MVYVRLLSPSTFLECFRQKLLIPHDIRVGPTLTSTHSYLYPPISPRFCLKDRAAKNSLTFSLPLFPSRNLFRTTSFFFHFHSLKKQRTWWLTIKQKQKLSSFYVVIAGNCFLVPVTAFSVTSVEWPEFLPSIVLYPMQVCYFFTIQHLIFRLILI